MVLLFLYVAVYPSRDEHYHNTEHCCYNKYAFENCRLANAKHLEHVLQHALWRLYTKESTAYLC
jgi:hypothetical protein